MHRAISSFPDHLIDAIEIGRQAPRLDPERARRVLVIGMGGSAMGGDLLRSFIASYPASPVDIRVSRGYEPPPCDRSTLVIASSYSGNTEETLAALHRIARHAGAVLVVTTGGLLGELARRRRYPVIALPSGLQPRAALAYSFVPLAWTLAVQSQLFGRRIRRDVERGIVESAAVTRSLARLYDGNVSRRNRAYAIAEALVGKIPVIYSSCDRMDVVNLRWRGQIQENAKQLAFGNLLPEMNHNELNGYGHPRDVISRIVPVFLRDREDHPRVTARIQATRLMLKKQTSPPIVVESTGESTLARIFSLVHLGDWVSYWLAMLNGVDPTPVAMIEGLKRRLRG